MTTDGGFQRGRRRYLRFRQDGCIRAASRCSRSAADATTVVEPWPRAASAVPRETTTNIIDGKACSEVETRSRRDREHSTSHGVRGPGWTRLHARLRRQVQDLARGRASSLDQLWQRPSTHLRDPASVLDRGRSFLAELDNLLSQLGIDGCATTSSGNPGAACWAPNMRCEARRPQSCVQFAASMALWIAEATGFASISRPRSRIRFCGTRPQGRRPIPNTKPRPVPSTPAMSAGSDPGPKRSRALSRRWPATRPSMPHELAERVPRDRNVTGVEHRRPIATRGGTDLAHPRRLRRSDPSDGSTFCRLHPRRTLDGVRASSHMPHVEERDLCMEVVGRFLGQHD